MEEFDEEVVKAELKLAREFLVDAKLLLDKNSMRSASSRMYYSIFHAARAVLFRYGFQPKTHKGTFVIFGKEVIGKELASKEHAMILSKAYSLREQADYQPLITIEKKELKGLLVQAESFLKDMKKIISKK